MTEIIIIFFCFRRFESVGNSEVHYHHLTILDLSICIFPTTTAFIFHNTFIKVQIILSNTVVQVNFLNNVNYNHDGEITYH